MKDGKVGVLDYIRYRPSPVLESQMGVWNRLVGF